MMKKIVYGIDWVLKWFVILVMAANVLNVLWQVFSRFVLANPSSWTEELARYLLIWLAILGAAYVHRLKMHIAITFITDKFQAQSRFFSQVFIQICVLLFALFVMVIGGYNLVDLTLSLGQTSAALQVKMGYVYSVIPISGLLIMFYAVLFILDQFRIHLWDLPPIMDEPDASASSPEQEEI